MCCAKKIISPLLLSSLLVPQVTVGADPSNMTCSYAGKYNQCVSANENGTARSIDDFICIESRWWWEEMLQQIILDEKFKEIDEEAEDYLEKLEKDKEAYFWETPKASFLEALDDINANFAQYEYYWQKYNEICTKTVLEEFLECTDSIANINVPDFIDGIESWVCISMMETKLEVYKQVAYDTLKLNRLAARQDDRKQYVIEEREKYSWVMQIMLNILWYMERIVNGWVTKTKNPHT